MAYYVANIRAGAFKGNPVARDSQSALIALNRFGFGARGGAAGDLVNAASDPRGFVKAELSRPNAALLEVPGLQSTPALAEAVFAYQAQLKQAREMAAKAPSKTPEDGNANAAMAASEPTQPNAVTSQPQPLNIIQKTYRAEALARLQRAVIADCGLVERLVAFWSNHFCISASKGPLARMWAGAFEREAIRPHVLGRFADMLKAVEQHPAMLFFLDNQQSLGPDSRAGQTRKRGLNENLAREIMELHTLGVGGGYSQQDVIQVARAFTGWTVVPVDPGAFGGLGEAIAKNALKGDQLILEARVRADNWTDKQGEKQYDHSFVVESFRFGAPGPAKREQFEAQRGHVRELPEEG